MGVNAVGSVAQTIGESGRFQVLGEVGRGATGVVYEVVDRERNAKVAVKALRNLSPEALLLLKKEFRAVQDVQHPNLVQLGELFEDHGLWFFTMELVAGEPLLAYLRPGDARSSGADGGERPGYDEPRLRRALAQLVRGLATLHAASKVHRDVKPSNVLVTREGRVVLLDFGLVRDVGRDRGPEDGSLVGTVAYMAPEQAAGETVGPEADFYAVGVVLYQALTGRLPFQGTVNEILRAKLGREPLPPSRIAPGVPADLETLCTRLLRLAAKTRPTAPEIVAVLEGVASRTAESLAPRDVFVGREEELSTLERAFDEARREGALTVAIVGESGVGKSCLVRRFTESRRERCPELVLFSGRCYERESVRYKGVDDLVDDLSEFLRTLPEEELVALIPPHAALLARAFPVLQQVPGFQVDAGATRELEGELVPRELRERVFASARELLARIANARPVLVVIDDLQWADADSIALLREVLRPPQAPPLLLVVTKRTSSESRRASSEGRDEPDSLELGGPVRTIHLEKLARTDAERLVTELLASSAYAVDVSVVRAIAQDAKGHPLFIDELVRQRGAGGGAARPLVRLDDALWARVQALPPGARRLLELLAIVGVPVSQELAGRAASMGWGEVFDALTVLRAEKLVRTDGARREDIVGPYHDRVRECVAAHVDPDVRRAWHGTFAAALERSDAADAEALAFHWSEAGRPARARHYAQKAAAEAARSFAFERAADLYRMALGIQGGEAEPDAMLKGKLAEALSNAGREAEAAVVWLELAHAASADDAIELRQAAAEGYLCSGHFEEGQAVLREAIDASGLAFPRTPLRALLLLLALRLVIGLRGLGFVPRDASSAPSTERLRVDGSWSAARGLIMHDNVRGMYFQVYSLLAALRLGDRLRIVRTLAMESIAGGGPSRARSLAILAEAKRLIALESTAYERGVVALADGGLGYFWGEWERALPLLRGAESVLREQCLRVTWELTSAHLMLNRCLTYTGRFRELAERAAPMIRDAEKRNDRYALVNLRTSASCWLALVRDDPESAASLASMELAGLPENVFRVQHYLCTYALVQADLYRGRPAAAYERVLAAWKAMKKSMLLRVSIVHIQTLDQRARAALAAAAADAASAPRLLKDAEQCAAALERIGRELPWAAAFASVLRVGLARARGTDVRAVVEALALAADRNEARGMALHAWALRYTRGVLLGPEGDGEREAAERRMRDEGVVAPARMVALLVPRVADVSSR